MSNPVSKLSWDDLPIIRAIGKSGALAPAAEMLGINCSTIARRLSKVEEVLGATLFDRRRTGYVATVHGRELISLAERVEVDVVSVARRVLERGRRHAGEPQIATSDIARFVVSVRVFASVYDQLFAARTPGLGAGAEDSR